MHGRHGHRQDGGHRRPQAELGREGGQGSRSVPAPSQRFGFPAHLVHPVERGGVGAEGQQLGSAVNDVDHVRRDLTGERRVLLVRRGVPDQSRRDRARHQQWDAEGDRGEGQGQTDHDQTQRGGAGGHPQGQHGAEVQVLQGVDVVNGPAQEVTAPPTDQRRRDALG